MRWLWVTLLVVLVGAVQTGAVVGWVLFKPHPKAIVYAPSANPTSPWRGTSSPHFEETPENPKLPTVQRSVPVFDARLLDGCSQTDLDSIQTSINDAINTGAPLYNDGDFDGCFRAYESAALSLERTIPKTCKGPTRVLKTGRDHASKRSTPAEQAWAMRDAFDGLLDVIDRRGPEL
jgi:hypothetical protein